MSQTVLQVITRAMRMNGILPSNVPEPASHEADDALIVFNQLQRSLFGTIIGTKLEPETAASGTVRYGALYECGVSAVTLTCPANPRDGWRFGVADAKSALGTYNVTLAPNGRKLNGVTTSTVLSTNDTFKTYFFRADTGNWVEEKDLVLSDTVYFPDELLGAMAAMLALEMAEEYGREVSAVIAARAKSGRDRFQLRYGRLPPQPATQAAQ